MSTRMIAACAAIVAAWLLATAGSASTQGAPPALGGKVASDRGGPMEGVLVSAKKPGSTITVGSREPAAEAVKIRIPRKNETSLGLVAAAKILVETAGN